MTPQEIGIRLAYGVGVAAVPIALMRGDRLRYGMLTTTLALAGFSFSGGWVPTAVAGGVVFLYQLYLRFAVRKLRWVAGTCLTLGAFVTHQAIFLPARISTWETSITSKVMIASIGVAVSMIVTCVEMKVRRIKETLQKDIAEAAGAIKEKIKGRIAGQ